MKRRELFKSLVAAPLLFAGAQQAVANAAADGILRPKRLMPGNTIGLIAPASNAAEDEEIRFAVDIIKSLGFKVKQGKHLYQRDNYLAGTDQQRAADLNTLFLDTEVHGIFCLRGGYGTPRILPFVDYQAIAANPKVLMGYSDITALHNAIFLRTGLITFHGPVAGQQFTPYTHGEFERILMRAEVPTPIGKAPSFDAVPGRVERDNRVTRFVGGRAQGRLVGGNLTMLTSVLGTPFQPDFRHKILFLEDIGEAPYRIDRMLTQLWLAGILNQVVGIAFGKFTDVKTTGNSFSIESIIQQRCGNLSIPVVRGLMFGHVEDQSIVPVGGLAELDGDKGSLVLVESVLA